MATDSGTCTAGFATGSVTACSVEGVADSGTSFGTTAGTSSFMALAAAVVRRRGTAGLRGAATGAEGLAFSPCSAMGIGMSSLTCNPTRVP